MTVAGMMPTAVAARYAGNGARARPPTKFTVPSGNTGNSPQAQHSAGEVARLADRNVDAAKATQPSENDVVSDRSRNQISDYRAQHCAHPCEDAALQRSEQRTLAAMMKGSPGRPKARFHSSEIENVGSRKQGEAMRPTKTLDVLERVAVVEPAKVIADQRRSGENDDEAADAQKRRACKRNTTSGPRLGTVRLHRCGNVTTRACAQRWYKISA